MPKFGTDNPKINMNCNNITFEKKCSIVDLRNVNLFANKLFLVLDANQNRDRNIKQGKIGEKTWNT